MVPSKEEAFLINIQKLLHENMMEEVNSLIDPLPLEFSSSPLTRIKLGELFYLEFHYTEALDYFTNLLSEISGDDSQLLAMIRFNLARTYMVLDYEILAEDNIRQAIELDPNSVRYFDFWIKLLSIQKRFSDILALLPSNQPRFMESGIALNYLAEALISEGKFLQAEAILPFVLKYRPGLKIALIHCATIAEQRYDWDMAEEYLKAATISTNYVDDYEIFLAWERLIQLYENLQNEDARDQAQAEFDRVLDEYRQMHPNVDI